MDPKTVKAAARGNPEAFNEALRAISGPTLKFFSAMLPDAESAKAAVGDTFVRLARGTSRAATAEDLWTWAMPAVHRVAADFSGAATTSPAWEPEAGGIWFKEALRALPLDQREVFVCVCVLGWDPSTTADRLALRVEEVNKLLRLARERLVTGSGEAAL